jgi:uncharacterized protein YaiI (UPF0178 family)
MPKDNLSILVDADSCPVKPEIYKVALRHQTQVVLVSNSYMKIPDNKLFELVLVSDGFDAADDYIAEKSCDSTIVITADILLADRCLKSNAKVLAPNGIAFTNDSIGTAVATRALMEDLRAGGEQHGGPAPFSKNDRSRFLSSLHETLLKQLT